MKYMVISDIHGSYYYLEKAINKFEELKCDKLITLGDYLYHGPRNPLPEGYDTLKCVELLKKYKDKIIAIRGNCDAQIDEELLEIKMYDYFELKDKNKVFFLTHGHIYDEFDLPNTKFDYLLMGHYHIQKNYKKDNVIFLSPGSISLPKSNSVHGYMIIENGKYSIHDLLTDEQVNKTLRRY